ncbi:MAG: ATP-binding cassette domain-containing protein [Ruminiclostridium sp.]|nr:ATP-binding cassette domain-containing protein [Ruminiclostridium sp.]
MTLKLQNINKHYKTNHALKNFTYSFNNGIYGLLGPNGAGKSTLINILAGNVIADDGSSILYDNHPIKHHNKEFRSKIGFMPQQQSLYDNFTARHFMLYIAALKGIKSKQAEEETKELLTRVELIETADKNIGSFSGGMKQRVLVAQAMLGQPEILLLDEPTAGLDPRQRVIIRDLIKHYAKDRIVLISTHITSDIETIADEVIMMNKGDIVCSGKVSELCGDSTNGKITLEQLYMQIYNEKDEDK